MKDDALGPGRCRHGGKRADHFHGAVIVANDRHVLAGPDRKQLPPDELGALRHVDDRRRHGLVFPAFRCRLDRHGALSME